MVSKTLLCGVVATLSTSAAAYQALNVIWSTGAFSTISGPGGGGEVNHDSGFVVTDEDGNTIYANPYPGDYSPCQRPQQKFTLDLPCFNYPRTFGCLSKFDGSPDKCYIYGKNGEEVSSGNGHQDTTFFGIGVAQDAACGTYLLLSDGEECHGDMTSQGHVSNAN